MKKEEKLIPLEEVLEKMKAPKSVWWNISAFFYRNWYKLTNVPKEIKWFIQRGKRGWAECDVWGLNTYLARVIEETTGQLAKEAHGCPMESENDPMTLGKWIDILNDISTAFYYEKEITGYDLIYVPLKDYDKVAKNIKEDFKYVNEKMGTESCRIMSKKEVKEYEKGWRLFRKYFGAMWD